MASPTVRVSSASRLGFAVMSVPLFVIGVTTARGDTRRDTGTAGAEPAAHHSYVRDAKGNIVATDAQYATDIKNNFTGGSVDVLMQQCYGGGFLNDIAALAKPHTFASSTAWNEPSWSLELPKPPANGPRASDLTEVENFTRSWRKSADLFPTFGMLNNFRIAANDGIVTNPATADPKARYSPPGQTIGPNTYVEHPQYQSPDDPINRPDGSIGGTNNDRTLTPPAGAKEYCILVAWDEPDSPIATRDAPAVDIARINKTLFNVIGAAIPVRNIVVLYGNTPRDANLGPYSKIKGDGNATGEDLPTFFVDGPNSRQNWLDALSGKLFVNDNNTLGVNYGANDRLFIYNTGHGLDQNVAAPPVAQAAGMRYDIALVNNFNTTVSDDDVETSVADADGTDLLQLALRTHITDPSVHLQVNGTDLGSLASLLVTDPNATYEIDDFVPDPVNFYEVDVAHSLLATNAADAQIVLTNTGFNANLVAAFTFRGGDQEFTAVVLPEPATAFVSLCLLAIASRRRRSMPLR